MTAFKHIQRRSYKRHISNVIAELKRLKIKVLSHNKHVIYIDQPSAELQKHSVEITQSLRGKRSNFCATQFSGFCIRWEAE